MSEMDDGWRRVSVWPTDVADVRDDDTFAFPRTFDYPFFVIATPGMNDDEIERRYRYFAMLTASVVRQRSGHFPAALFASPSDPNNQVELFLRTTLERICRRTNSLTCVIEPYHVDGVHRDLYSTTYSKGYFDTSRTAIRISLFNDVLDDQAFHERSGIVADWERARIGMFHARDDSLPSLSQCFIGAIVCVPVGYGIIGRTLLAPQWVCDGNAAMRLSRFRLSVRGKRVPVTAFPYRKQDDDVLTCAELTLLNLMCYFSNEYGEYPITMPRQITQMVERNATQRVRPASGLSYNTMGRVLRECGFHPLRYHVDGLVSAEDQFYDGAGNTLFRRALRAYVDSGIPVAVNVQPTVPAARSVRPDGSASTGGSMSATDLCGPHTSVASDCGMCDRTDEDGRVGHSVLVIGVEEEREPQWRPFGDAVPVHQVLGPAESGTAWGHRKIVSIALASDLERDARYVVIDDAQLPYALMSFDQLSVFHGMRPVELLAPLTSQMVLDALDAYELACSVLSSAVLGLASEVWGIYDSLADDEQIVMSMRMVSARSYIRDRVATSSHYEATIYVDGTLPHHSWLFELYRSDGWTTPSQERRAFAEILIDATSPTLSDAIAQVVLMRVGNRVYRHNQNGSSGFFEIVANDDATGGDEASGNADATGGDEASGNADEAVADTTNMIDEQMTTCGPTNTPIVSFAAFDRNLRHVEAVPPRREATQ